MYQQVSQSYWLKLPLLLVNSEPSSLTVFSRPLWIPWSLSLHIPHCQSLASHPGACTEPFIIPAVPLPPWMESVQYAHSWCCLWKLQVEGATGPKAAELVFIWLNNNANSLNLAISKSFLAFLTLREFGKLTCLSLEEMLQLNHFFLKVCLKYHVRILHTLNFFYPPVCILLFSLLHFSKYLPFIHSD